MEFVTDSIPIKNTAMERTDSKGAVKSAHPFSLPNKSLMMGFERVESPNAEGMARRDAIFSELVITSFALTRLFSANADEM